MENGNPMICWPIFLDLTGFLTTELNHLAFVCRKVSVLSEATSQNWTSLAGNIVFRYGAVGSLLPDTS